MFIGQPKKMNKMETIDYIVDILTILVAQFNVELIL